MSSGLFYHNTLDGLFSIVGCPVSLLLLLLLCIIDITTFSANSVDPEQTPPSAVSDLGLHCLPIILLEVSNQF